MNTQRVEEHTPRTMGELVKEHASRNTLSTHHGFEMLELSGTDEHTCAANTYLAALSVIRKQEKVNEALVAALADLVGGVRILMKVGDLEEGVLTLAQAEAALKLAKEPA